MINVYKFAILVLTLAIPAFPQIVGSSEADLDVIEILDRSAAARNVYLEKFTDLLSRETKTFEKFSSNGSVKKGRTVVSTFIVYPLSHDPKSVSEFRNVLFVDGTPVDKSGRRAQDFFDSLKRIGSSHRELRALEKESLRFDGTLQITGLTLFQAITLADNFRPFFDFTLEGKEIVGGRNAFVVAYRQARTAPVVNVNPVHYGPAGTLSLNYEIETGGQLVSNARLEGKLWIDAESFHIRREVRILKIHAADSEDPIVAGENVFEFQDSAFGILTPERVMHTQYRLKRGRAIKEARVTFTYSEFTRPDVEVRSANID